MKPAIICCRSILFAEHHWTTVSEIIQFHALRDCVTTLYFYGVGQIKPLQKNYEKHKCTRASLRKKCPYSGLYWSKFFPHFSRIFPAFSRIRAEYGEILPVSLYSVHMSGNAGKMPTRITPNTDTFYVELILNIEHLVSANDDVIKNCQILIQWNIKGNINVQIRLQLYNKQKNKELNITSSRSSVIQASYLSSELSVIFLAALHQ